jgi:tetratricopeptide (TPR) repeat protein
MKSAQLSLVLALVTLSISSRAQIAPVSHLPGGASQDVDTKSVALMGKVATEDGSDLQLDTVVILQCGNDDRASTHTDGKGEFSLVVASEESALGASSQPNLNTKEVDLNMCELRAEASGYRSEQLQLAGEHLIGIVQVGTIVLHPIAGTSSAEGFAISATSLAAPDKAKKDFQKGQEQAKKGKWAAAGEYFRKAVQTYPRYALAWLELGRTQMQQHDFAEAQQSFQQATAQDSNLIPAYMELARVAVEQKQWKSLADATDRILELSPDSAATFCFLNAAAHFNMGNVSRAEASVTRGLRLDVKHEVPQLEYLYGMVLVKQQNYEAAIAHLKAYLQLAPKAADAQQAQQKIAAIEKQLSALQNRSGR